MERGFQLRVNMEQEGQGFSEENIIISFMEILKKSPDCDP
jgi:hypothetical protein